MSCLAMSNFSSLGDGSLLVDTVCYILSYNIAFLYEESIRFTLSNLYILTQASTLGAMYRRIWKVSIYARDFADPVFSLTFRYDYYYLGSRVSRLSSTG